MAVEGDFSTILSVLLENGADPDQMDDDGNGGRFARPVGMHAISMSLLRSCGGGGGGVGGVE